MKKIWKIQSWMNKLEPSLFWITIVRYLSSSLLPFVEVYFSSKIVDHVAKGQLERSVLLLYLGLMVGSYILKEVIVICLDYQIDVRGKRLEYRMDQAVHLKALSLDYALLEDPETLQLIQRAKESQNAMGGVWVWFYYLGAMLESAFTIIFSVSIVAYLLSMTVVFSHLSIESILTSYIGSILIIVSIIGNIFAQKIIGQKNNNQRREMMEMNIVSNRRSNYLGSLLSENYAYGKVIRLYGMESYIDHKLENLTHTFRANYGYHFKALGKLFAGSDFFARIASLIPFLVIFVRAFTGMFPIGEVLVFIQGFQKLSEGMGRVSRFHMALMGQCQCFETYLDFLELDDQKQSGMKEIEKQKHVISFENVSFKYPGSEVYALKDVSYTFKENERLAIVGTNGAGKTTFIKLLCRLYEPTSGVIKLNGVPIQEYDKEAYRKLLSVVFQDFQLFAFPIAQNVASSEVFDTDLVLETLYETGIKERVENMEDGINTYLYKHNEQGVEVSGGEAQKIAIARALYKDGAYVILDEPTAALDPISEYEIYKNFDDMVKGKTSVYITHRMSSCRFCDNILVFDKGELVEEGEHEILSKQDGLYAKMWSAQAKYYQ